MIVLLHAAVIGGTFLFGSGRPRWAWLALLLTAQPVRAWVLVTLGHRWNTRAAVPVRMNLATEGPYRFVRHPNYSVIGVELLALPMAFRLPWLALFASLANAALLSLRIPEEERLLGEIPGYGEHFGRLPRFVPRWR